MGDELITGFFTIIGTILGFGLARLSDFFREKQEKRRNHTWFMIKLSNISGTIRNIKSAAEKIDKITTDGELSTIRAFLISTDLKDELSKMEIILEKSIDVDMKHSDIILRFEKLRSGINGLLILSDIHTDKFDDIKPNIVTLTTMISQVIDELIDDMYYQYTNKTR